MDMLNSDLNARQQLINAKYVTRLAKQRKAYTTTSIGTTAQVAPTIYYGPPLDVEGDESFKNYKIYPIEPSHRRVRKGEEPPF